MPTDDEPMNKPVMMRCEALARADSGISHGFFTRLGGISRGIYSGLNAGLGSGDERDAVLANRSLALARLGAESAFLATPHQTHSSDVFAVAGPWPETERPVADAVVTDRPGIALGVLTADCGAVLLADGEAGIVGAAHAGWKGALGGVIENTIAGMEALGARKERIRAAVGPTISQANYEVGPEFVDRFLARSTENSLFFSDSGKAGHARFDLPAYIVARLEKAGVQAMSVGVCTYADAERFYSFRRATHRGEPDYGRQLSTILVME